MKFPSELIYALWSTCTGLTFGGTAVPAPFYFNGAYVHMPKDFTKKGNQLILVYLILWNLINEEAHNYTKGKIGFTTTRKEIVFGTPEQSAAVRALLKKYEDEPCMTSTVKEVLEKMKKEEIEYKEMRKWLKERLSELLEKIGYFNEVVIKPVN